MDADTDRNLNTEVTECTEGKEKSFEGCWKTVLRL
jgi:hypothetical protein